MEKIFEDKEFHGSVTFFGTVIVMPVGGFAMSGDLVITAGDLTMTEGDLLMSSGNLQLTTGDVILTNAAKLRLDGSASGDTYLQQSASNVIQWVAGGVVQMYNSGYGMRFPNGIHIEAVDKTADDTAGSTNVIAINENIVNVIGVATNADDQIYLPRADQVENGHTILIMCDAGSNFEIRTPSTRADKINTVDCGSGGNEYLATDNEVIKCVMRNVTDGWVLTGTTALGAVAVAVVPDA